MSLGEAALFAKVVELSGFSAAARQLNMPKTTVSKKVRDLERELGVRLLNRTTRRVSLTEAGIRYYEHCCVALERMSAAAREAREAQEQPAGEIRVGGPASLATTLLLPMLVEFLKRHPRFTATLLIVPAHVILNSNELDVLISVRPFDKSVRAAGLARQVQMGLFASPRYVKGYGSPATPAELKSHHTVWFGETKADEELVWRLHRGSQRSAVKLQKRPRLQANDPMPIRSAIIGGLGIGMLALRFAAEAQQAGDLVRVLPTWFGESVELNALYSDGPGTSLSFKTRAFLDFATQWFKKIELIGSSIAK